MESERFLRVRIALRNCGRNNTENTDRDTAGGYDGLRNALKMTPREVIEEIGKSGFRERSGNGFPVAEKWRLCLDASGSEKYVICNAAEGDPDSLIPRTLLEEDPWSVLEGMLIGAYAIGATVGWIYIDAGYRAAINRGKAALNQMEGLGLLGNRILDSKFSFRVEMREAPSNLACGDETFLINAMEDRKTLPFVCSSRLPIYGLGGKPTLVHNTETWTHVSAILQKGADWYANYGTDQCRGTKVFTLLGKMTHPGLIEVPMGTTLRQIVYGIGGGVPEGEDLKAGRVGGPTGGYLPAGSLDLPMDYEHLSESGVLMGSGTLIVINDEACIVDHVKRSLSVIQGESCGKCVFCREGTMQMAEILSDIADGRGRSGDIELLIELSEGLKKGSQCDLGREASNPVLTMIKYFGEELGAHIKEKRCTAQVCTMK